MRRRRRARGYRLIVTGLLVLLVASLWQGTTVGAGSSEPLPPTSFTPAVLQAIQGIDTGTLTGYVGDLSGEWPVDVAGETVTLTTRYSLADEAIRLAETYALEQFEELGFSPACHSYRLETLTRCNIVAVQPGVLAPEKIIVLGAHLDSITQSKTDRFTTAPGADDNASGAAAVLAVAEVLRDHDLAFTLHYVLFTGEEQGLYGSRAYAEYLATGGEQVLLMVNMDMIGYNTPDSPPDIDVHIRAGTEGDGDRAIADVFSRTLSTYNLGLIPEIVPSGTSASDHAAFWDEGYPAVLVIEDFEDFNDNRYHSTEDLLSGFDLTYFTRATQGVAGTVMQLAGVVDFVAKPALVSSGQPVTLWAISHLPETLPVSYSWDLGDGVPVNGPLISPIFSPLQYPTVRGTWQVTMTVTYEGQALSISKTLPVHVWDWDVFLPAVIRTM